MTTSDLFSILDEMHAYIRRDIAAGFDEPDEIVDSCVELMSDSYEARVLRPHAERMVRQVLREHAADQQSWPIVTDCDRLDAAFEVLEQRGIVARQHFSCCGTCGVAEIWSEMQEMEKAGLPVRGYTFYHVQDTETAVEGSGLYLSYGAAAEGEEAALEIGREVVEELTRQGLATIWDGCWSQRIYVYLDWKRRRPLFE